MNVVHTGYELWDALVKEAGLDLDRYDLGVATQVRRFLHLPDEGSISDNIRKENITSDKLLAGFFSALQSFTEMYSDILKLIEDIGLKEGKNNLLVEFDFEQGQNQFRFDLENFRKQFEIWRIGSRSIIIEEWSYRRLWRLPEFLDYDQTITTATADWVDQYNAGYWPENEIAAPTSGNRNLDVSLGHVWQIRRAVIQASKSVGERREDLRASGNLPSNSVDAVTITDGKIEESEGIRRFLYILNSDHWARTLTTAAHSQARRASIDPIYADELNDRLKSVLEDPPPTVRDVEEAIREFEELLQLPIWKHRYELYSIWILTQIITAFGGTKRFKFLLEDEIFHIPFAAKRLATLEDTEPPVHICSEIRYPLASPRGKSRKSGMQPDYSITVDSTELPVQAFALVECKQYLKEARRSFANAIADYAEGQPDAQVILVNYGPATEHIKDYVPSGFHDRASIVGNLQPLQNKKIKEFHLILQELLAKNSISIIGADENTANNINISDAARLDALVEIQTSTIEKQLSLLGLQLVVSLCWKSHPRDLDLCALIPQENGHDKIDYFNKGTLSASPWVSFDKDEQNGFGPETICILETVPGIYKFYVHLFSNEPVLAGSGAIIIAGSAAETKIFKCPEEGDGKWWHVFDFDSESGEFIKQNVIQISNPHQGNSL